MYIYGNEDTVPKKKKTGSKDIYALLGENIAFFRSRASMTLEALAGLSGISTSYLANIEKAHKNPTLHTVQKISDALDLDIATVLTYGNSKKKETEDDLIIMNINHIISKKSIEDKKKIYNIIKQL